MNAGTMLDAGRTIKTTAENRSRRITTDETQQRNNSGTEHGTTADNGRRTRANSRRTRDNGKSNAGQRQSNAEQRQSNAGHRQSNAGQRQDTGRTRGPGRLYRLRLPNDNIAIYSRALHPVPPSRVKPTRSSLGAFAVCSCVFGHEGGLRLRYVTEDGSLQSNGTEI
ncbi:hypothetical protein BD410DRAFT_804950 [Rickenella mellea]|uniref:Uncharacterized protein n=1 Tax=Rickenella mellea TaxID=50990 RepID=A0A4Y7PYA0_9AGAM|nr:hypothetical protein BD410DRAFT_804950 [Rickenella mellea]